MKNNSQLTRVLVTGAGGPAATSFLRAVQELPGFEFHMADMDPYSTGLYLVPAGQRCLIPAGTASDFVDTVLQICIERKIDILLPTVDCELAKIADASDQFAAHNVTIALPPAQSLHLCYDKLALMKHLDGHAPLADYARIDNNFNAKSFGLPFIAKPRSGSGSRGIHLITHVDQLSDIPRDGSYMAQGNLPGAEYSVDVYISSEGQPIASVVRERLKIDSGIAVIGKTINDQAMCAMALKIAEKAGIRFTANVQFKRNPDGEPRLLEINPRFPGTMPLTVAAGANIPAMCMKDLTGEHIEPIRSYREIAMVREWTETFIDASEFLIDGSDQNENDSTGSFAQSEAIHANPV